MNNSPSIALELIRQLNETDEHSRIEAKATRNELGASALETVCAFSNEPSLGGGHILLGIAKDKDSLFPNYEAEGVASPDKIQSDFTTQCAVVFNIPIRPQLTVEIVRGNPVIVAFIAEASPGEKPVYFKNQPLPRAAFRRIGSDDIRCTDEDLAILYQGRQTQSLDEQPVNDTTLDDIDPDAIDAYRALRKAADPDADELKLENIDLLRSICCVKSHNGQLTPTIAGILLFGTKGAIRRCFPMMRVDYIRTEAREWIKEVTDQLNCVEIAGPLIGTITRANAAILGDLPRAFSLPADELQRKDLPIIPSRVIREALVNAVMHRSYREHSPVQIIRYPNRLEIRNPGYSLKSEELFGEPGSQPRNPKIASVLHDLKLAETKGIGVSVMMHSMKEAGLSPPYLESNRDANQFLAILLFHHFLSQSDIDWLAGFRELELSDDERQALVFARETGAINNAAYRGMSGCDTLTASGHLRRLREFDLLEMRGQGSATYYIPTRQLLRVASQKSLTASPLGKHEKLIDKHEKFGQQQEAEEDDPYEKLPEALQKMVDRIPAKASEEVMFKAILSLCEWRDLKASRIAEYCSKNTDHLRNYYLGPLLEKVLLDMTGPANSPKVRYKISPKGREWLAKARARGRKSKD